jgi:hypothetical protein
MDGLADMVDKKKHHYYFSGYGALTKQGKVGFIFKCRSEIVFAEF